VNAQAGAVLYGANNIFMVRSREDAVFECRIKGKILKNAQGDYNPLAAGDEVCFLPDAAHSGRGVLLSRMERKNAFLRWNKKGRSAQTIAANVDILVCVASPASPPFRPRFLDRLLIAARLSGIPALICLNKNDQQTTPGIEERLGGYETHGIRILRSCAAAGKADTAGLETAIRGKRAVFVGQSGVGKTSLLNVLSGGPGRKVGEISEKYNRGRHTTVLACLETWEGGEIIDTPGIREFDISGLASRDLRFFFSEFEEFSSNCRMGDCTHTHEPGCAVREAAENHRILFDRYESYCRIYQELLRREKSVYE
jgi:ribosome biogenesis GTPase